MANVKVKLNSSGMIKLFKEPNIQAVCRDVAESVVRNTGMEEGYNVSTWKGPFRAGATVWCDSPEAIKDNLENNTMLKALGSVVPNDKVVRQ